MATDKDLSKPYTIDQLADMKYSLQMHNLGYEEGMRLVNQCIGLIREKMEALAAYKGGLYKDSDD